MRWRIRYQLLVPLLILLLGVAGISTWTALASASRARRQIETHMRDVARTLNEWPVNFLNETVLRQMKGLSGAEYLLLTPEERLSTFAPAVARVVQPPDDSVSDDADSLRLGPRVVVQDTPYLCSGVRLHRGSTNQVLYIFYPESLWRDALWEAIRPSLVLGGFAGLASLALAVGVGQRLSRRIQELEQRTRLIAQGDFSPMPLPGRNDELRDLGQSVNEMAQRLAQLQETVQKTERLRLLGQVSGGLAHQLRNGITGARLAVQLHVRENAGQGDTEALHVALRQLTLLEAHLKRFLDLGRAGQLRLETCSLSALVDETVALLRPQCRHTHIDVRWQRPKGEVLTRADAGQLGQMLLNVIGNAIEAAGPNGWVEVSMKQKASQQPFPPWCILEVSDSGPGLTPEVASRLFEPFVTSKREGVGLGLAVARQVAEAHGGKIMWRREPDSTIFRIELPLEGEENSPPPASV